MLGNRKPQPRNSEAYLHDVHQGRQHVTSTRTYSKRDTTLRPGKEWQMLVDLIRQWAFPKEITTTTLWPEASNPYRFTL